MNEKIGSNLKIKKGAFFSYLTIIFEILINFFLLKYITAALGDEYGLYTLAMSVISIFLLDFGLSQAVTKFIAKFRLNNDVEGENKFLGLVLKIYFILDIFVLVACIIVFFCIPFLYQGLSPTELGDFEVVFIIVAIYSCISFPFLPMNGILSGHEEFSIVKILTMAQKTTTAIFLVICLVANLGLYAIVFANVLSALIYSLARLFIVFKKCKVRPNFKVHDPKMLKALLAFTVWIAIATLASRLSLGMMSTILANTTDSATVAIFGIAVTFETYAYTFSTAISNLFLPKVTALTESKDFAALNKSSIRVGKFQMMVSGLILLGFIVFGQDFLGLYLEPMYANSYFPAILLLLDVMLNCTLIIPQTTSYAMGTIKYVSLIDLFGSIIRLGLCWLMAFYLGMIGLVVCYVAGTFLINAVKLFFVFYKKQNLDLKHFCLHIYLRFLIPAGIVLCFGFLYCYTFDTFNWISLIVSIIVFCIVYFCLVFSLYFSKREREELFASIFKKIPFINRLSTKFSISSRANHYIPTFICGVLIFIAFFSSNYPYNDISLFFLLIFVSLLVFLYFYYYFPFKMFKDKELAKIYFRNIGIWFLVAFTLLVFISYLVTQSFDATFGLFKLFIIFWSAFIFTQLFSFKTFFKIFKNIFFVICSSSLIIYVVALIYGSNFSPTYDGTYYNYFYVIFITDTGGTSLRNCAIFWEPGIFSSFCCVALALEILFDRNKWYKQLPYYVVFALSLLSTFSLAGFILVIFLIPVAIAQFKSKITKILSYSLVGVLALTLILFFIIPDVFVQVFPFLADKGISFTTRFYSFFVDLEIFKSHPIFGVGSQYNYYFNALAEELYPGMLDTSLNTFGSFLASFGLGGILYIVFFLVSILSCNKFSWDVKLSLLLLAFLIFIKEPHSLSLISQIFIFYFLKYSSWMPNDENCYKIASTSIYAWEKGFHL